MTLRHTIQLLAITLAIFLFSACADGGDESSVDNRRNQRHNAPEVEMLWADGLRALNKAEFNNAVACGRRLLEISASHSGEVSGKAAIYGNIILGQGYLFSDSVDKSYPHLHEAELLCLKASNDSALASAYNGLGLYASNIEKDFPEALRYFFLGIDAAKRSNNERLHSLLLVNIASIYTLNNDPAGLRYALECYRHGIKKSDSFLRYVGALTAAYSYALRNTDTSRALDYIREAELILHSDSIRGASELYYIYGLLLRQDGRNDEAAECFRQSIDSLRHNNNEGDIRSHIEYSRILLAAGRKAHAVAILDSALRITDAGHSTIFRSDILRALSATHRALGNTASADAYSRIALAEDHDDEKAEKELLIEHIKSKYDLERADNEVNRQQIELLEKERTVDFLIVLIVCALILSGSFIWLYRRKSRLYSAIVRQATEAAREEERLRATIRRLELQGHNESAAPSDSAISDTPGSATDTIPVNGESNPEENENDKTTVRQPSKSPIPDHLSAAFESLMLDPAIYTDNLISKDKIARLLDTNRTYVSRLVNEVYHMSFPQFINSLRIKEAIRRLSDPGCDTPLKALADELGYNSMTTFYTKFNEATGLTPAAFRAKARDMKPADKS